MWECHSQPSWNEWNDREFGTLRVVLFFGSQGSETGSPTHGFDEKWGDFPLRKLVQKPLRKFFQQGPSPIIRWCVPISWRWMNYTGSLVGNHQMSQGIQGGRWWDGMGVNSTWKIWFLMFSGWWFQTCGFKHVVFSTIYGIILPIFAVAHQNMRFFIPWQSSDSAEGHTLRSIQKKAPIGAGLDVLESVYQQPMIVHITSQFIVAPSKSLFG